MDSFLADTQTPNTGALTTPLSQIIDSEEFKAVWGRLFPTYTHLEPVDLSRSTFTIGRAQDCDVIITERIFPATRCQTVSKVHFMITKELGQPPYITDLSKNGTFLNGKKIGKGKKNILQNDDEIAVGFMSLKVYVFKTMHTQENMYLPPELRRKYEPSRLLGIGACGEVKLIFDKVTCQPYAVKKIVKGNNSHKLNHINKIHREITILKSLCHPCIVSTKEIVETDTSVFIVLEYLEGGELTDYITSSDPLTEDQSKALFYQITLAVEYLHSKGITHRDLKPANVLLKNSTPNSILKLTDFGLSKIINDQQTVLRTVCGTPCYVAPEVLDRKVTCYDQQVDIWSMGVILYYMLSQELPFRHEDKGVLSKFILIGHYSMDSEKWKKVSDDAKDLVKKMLVVDPEKRIKIKEILNHPWFKKDTYMLSRVDQYIYEEQETEYIVDSDMYAPIKRRRTGNESDDSSRSRSSRNSGTES